MTMNDLVLNFDRSVHAKKICCLLLINYALIIRIIILEPECGGQIIYICSIGRIYSHDF